MPKDELHDLFNSVLAPFETLMVIFIVILIVLLKKLRLYENFPGSLFRWTLFIDLLYAMFIGPFRWLPGNTFYESMAYPTTESGCITAVLLDTFCQMGLLYTNCLIVGVVFYMVYFGRALGKKTRSDFKRWGMQGFWVLTLSVSISTCLGEVHNYVGWCTADSVAVIFKQLIWFILIIMQITMIIPTLVMLYQANRKNTRFATGTLIRFTGIMVTQAMGLFPIIAVEFLGLARKPIPRILMQLIAILFPSAHFIDCVMISIKLWPYFVTRIRESDGNGHCGYIAKVAQRSVIEDSEVNDMGHNVDGSVHTHGTKMTNIIQAYADRNARNTVYLAEKALDSDDSDDLIIIAKLKRKHKQEIRAKNKENNSDDASTSESEDDDVDLESHGESTMTNSTITKQQKSFFDKIPFWLHLLLTMSIPFFLLVAVSMIMVFDLAQTRDKSILIRQDVVFITYISDFLHESQKERGVTGVFMGSGGKTFGCEVLAQYRETDFWQERLQFYLNNQFVNVKLVTKSTFLQALIHMLRIPEHRDDVQNLRIAKSLGIGHYSAMNMFFVGIVAEICKTAKLGDDMQHRIFANLAYFSAKEIAGIERAMGSVAFSAGTFGGMGKYRSFVTRVSSQSTHLWFFQVYVNKQNSKFETEEMDNIAVQITELMRGKLLANDGPAMIAQDGGEWFNNMTLRINILRKIETLIANL
jgi:hypothetical protein